MSKHQVGCELGISCDFDIRFSSRGPSALSSTHSPVRRRGSPPWPRPSSPRSERPPSSISSAFWWTPRGRSWPALGGPRSPCRRRPPRAALAPNDPDRCRSRAARPGRPSPRESARPLLFRDAPGWPGDRSRLLRPYRGGGGAGKAPDPGLGGLPDPQPLLSDDVWCASPPSGIWPATRSRGICPGCAPSSIRRIRRSRRPCFDSWSDSIRGRRWRRGSRISRAPRTDLFGHRRRGRSARTTGSTSSSGGRRPG